jgi:hypothetical protein
MVKVVVPKEGKKCMSIDGGELFDSTKLSTPVKNVHDDRGEKSKKHERERQRGSKVA